MQKIRLLSQLLFLVVFVTLMILGKAQFWLGFILLSILLSAFLGRFYCGWACPINTLMRPTAWLARKLGLANKPVGKNLKTEKPRYIVFFIFLIGLAYTIYSITQGKKFPLPLIVIPFGLLVTIFINPIAWHRYLCPWGTLFSFTGRFARLGFKNNSALCADCGKCVKICPANVIAKKDKTLYNFTSTNCLSCFDCKSKCPKDAIEFGKIS